MDFDGITKAVAVATFSIFEDRKLLYCFFICPGNGKKIGRNEIHFSFPQLTAAVVQSYLQYFEFGKVLICSKQTVVNTE